MVEREVVQLALSRELTVRVGLGVLSRAGQEPRAVHSLTDPQTANDILNALNLIHPLTHGLPFPVPPIPPVPSHLPYPTQLQEMEAQIMGSVEKKRHVLFVLGAAEPLDSLSDLLSRIRGETKKRLGPPQG